jgi:secreted trypsin-like serine protease
MVYIYLLFFSFFLYNIEFVSSSVYSCNRSSECGCSKTDANINRIVGGESAISSSWGWAVSLQEGSGKHFCGGAIISSLHIITAAHCVENPSEIIRAVTAVVGINTLSQSASSMAQVRSIVRVMSHPLYNDYWKVNDIAVLRLNQPLDISNEKGIARLCLPQLVETNTVNNYPLPDTPLIAIGWGKLGSLEESIPPSRNLQQVTLNAMSAGHRMCQNTINNRQLQFCAGVIGGGKGKEKMINLLLIDLAVSSMLCY